MGGVLKGMRITEQNVSGTIATVVQGIEFMKNCPLSR